MDKRAGEHQDFPSEFFYLTVPKISAGVESTSVSQVSYIEKTYLQRVTSLFSVEIFFVPQCRKTS